MKTLTQAIFIVIALLSSGCDNKDPFKPKTELRTMVIGGVPVYERDYKLAQDLSAEQVQLKD